MAMPELALKLAIFIHFHVMLYAKESWNWKRASQVLKGDKIGNWFINEAVH